MVGTLGVIVRAKLRGVVSAASPIIAAVRDAGLHMDDGTVAVAPRGIGEEWRGQSVYRRLPSCDPLRAERGRRRGAGAVQRRLWSFLATRLNGF